METMAIKKNVEWVIQLWSGEIYTMAFNNLDVETRFDDYLYLEIYSTTSGQDWKHNTFAQLLEVRK